MNGPIHPISIRGRGERSRPGPTSGGRSQPPLNRVPGSGKTMLARLLPGILPLDRRVDRSCEGLLGRRFAVRDDPLITRRPPAFTAPSHLCFRADRRGIGPTPAGRGKPRAPRHPLRGRADSVSKRRPRDAACAARGGRDPHRPCRWNDPLSVSLRARGGLEYNTSRPHSSLGWRSPVAYVTAWKAANQVDRLLQTVDL